MLREVGRFLRLRFPDDLGWQLEQIANRGVQTTIVFSRGEPGIELLRMQGGSAIKRLGERCRVHIIDGADHTFSRSSSRAVLEKSLSDELFARQGYPGTGRAAGQSTRCEPLLVGATTTHDGETACQQGGRHSR
jgi:hypothetical protein